MHLYYLKLHVTMLHVLFTLYIFLRIYDKWRNKLDVL